MASAVVSAKTQRHQNLRNLFKAAVRSGVTSQFFEDFEGELAEEKDIESRWSIRELFETFVDNGRELVRHFEPGSSSNIPLFESAEIVDTGNFSSILTSMLSTRALQAFDSPEFIGDKLVETIPTVYSGERLLGVTGIGDDVEVVGEGGLYPNAVFGEEWVDTPETKKRGVLLHITKEMILFDQTGLVLRNAAQLSNSLAINKEKRILDAVLGISTMYRRNGSAAQATYQTDNTVTSNPLVDYKSLDKAMIKFDEMSDPNTGEPIAISRNTIIVPRALENTANAIYAATHVREGTGSGTTQTYTSGNRINGNFQILSSPYIKRRTSSDSTWFIGDPKKAFAYMQNWPIKVERAPKNNDLEFSRDIAASFKVSERGTPAVIARQYMEKCTA